MLIVWHNQALTGFHRVRADDRVGKILPLDTQAQVPPSVLWLPPPAMQKLDTVPSLINVDQGYKKCYLIRINDWMYRTSRETKYGEEKK